MPKVLVWNWPIFEYEVNWKWLWFFKTGVFGAEIKQKTLLYNPVVISKEKLGVWNKKCFINTSLKV